MLYLEDYLESKFRLACKLQIEFKIAFFSEKYSMLEISPKNIACLDLNSVLGMLAYLNCLL